MAHSVLTDARLYIDHNDLSGDTNSVDLNLTTKAVADVCFGQSVEVSLPGLTGWSMGAAGLLTMADDASEEDFNAKWNRTTSIVTASPTGTDGERAYFGQAFQGQYESNGKIGEAFKWSWGAAASGLIVPGTIIHTKASHAATFNGSAFQLGAVAAGKLMYVALHVFTASGTTLDVIVQSDDNSGFTSATTRITFTQVTTVAGAQLGSVAGSITDDYWRIRGTIVGSGPYVLAVSAGIV
jgi:hypothetical protein